MTSEPRPVTLESGLTVDARITSESDLLAQVLYERSPVVNVRQFIVTVVCYYVLILLLDCVKINTEYY